MTFHDWLDSGSLESKSCNDYFKKYKDSHIYDDMYISTNHAFNGGLKEGQQQTINKIIKILQGML